MAATPERRVWTARSGGVHWGAPVRPALPVGSVSGCASRRWGHFVAACLLSSVKWAKAKIQCTISFVKKHCLATIQLFPTRTFRRSRPRRGCGDSGSGGRADTYVCRGETAALLFAGGRSLLSPASCESCAAGGGNVPSIASCVT